MAYLLKYLSVLSLLVMSACVYAESIYRCPIILKCKTTCKLPPGYAQWKIIQPLVKTTPAVISNTREIKNAFLFYGSIYTKYQNIVTVTCLYGSKTTGPKIVLDKAAKYVPVMQDSQWGPMHSQGRQTCIASLPYHCSYVQRD